MICREATMASGAQSAGGEENSSSSTANELKQEASKIAGAAEEAVADKKNIAAEYVEAVAVAIDRGAQELEQKGRSESASLARGAADQLEGLAKQITSRQPRELLDDFQNFARRQPALCFGVAALAGFGLVRFLKSSAARTDATSSARMEKTPAASDNWRH
jgi:hypothetical protein